MKLSIKHFKTGQRVDVTDEFGNVVMRRHYSDPHIDLLTSACTSSWVRGYCEGWMAAKNSIGNCESDDRFLDIDKMNETNWGRSK